MAIFVIFYFITHKQLIPRKQDGRSASLYSIEVIANPILPSDILRREKPLGTKHPDKLIAHAIKGVFDRTNRFASPLQKLPLYNPAL
ncbi:MAG TPA: hypothetical protein DER33_05420 [Syntrophomonas sp.]|nr:hypothetical protein [Syntrophomonas sp.]